MKQRTYPVPKSIQSALLGETATIGDVDLLVSSGAGSPEARTWATALLAGYTKTRLDKMLGDDPVLPHGLVKTVDDVDIVVALQRRDQFWQGDWGAEVEPGLEVLTLTEGEIAMTAAAFEEGAQGLALMAITPVARIRETSAIRATAGAPAGAKTFAIVDELDHTAVLDVIAVAPGPIVYRRHDGTWGEDTEWLRQLKSVKPPKVVPLSGDQLDGVVAQIDESTSGKPFSKTEDDTSMQSSGYDMFETELLEARLDWMLTNGLVASRMPANLQKYWLFGRGAAKIRWGTPGAWRRCHRQLRKYMNNYAARGACTNLSQKLGGQGVATHVGRG